MSEAEQSEEQVLKLAESLDIGPAEIIAVRRDLCGLIVHPDGTEERLPDACEWARLPGEEPSFKLGSVFGKTKRLVGRQIAEKKRMIWCERCGCPLARKTEIGFDPVTRKAFEALRCPLKKW